MKKLMILMALIMLSSSARADYHYASHTGSNVYPYTSWATAALLIQDAVNAADQGDTIYVGSGTWNQQVQLWDNNIALIGMGIDSTIWENYTTDYNIRIYGDTVTVEGFSFLADYFIYPNISISCFYHGYVVIKNNYFYGYGIGVAGNLGGLVQNNYFENNESAIITVAIKKLLVFENNTIFHNYNMTSIDVEDLLPDSSKFYIRKNLFYADRGFQTLGSINFYDTDTVFVHNNVFFKKMDIGGVGNASFGYTHNYFLFYNNSIDGESENIGGPMIITGIKAPIGDTTRTVDNNIVINCEQGVYLQARIRYSNFFNIDDYGDAIFTEGNIFTDPMFTDTIGFYLQAYSPAIDAGDPTVFDIDGSRSDMGAYGGPDGELYIYQDLPPRVPDSLTAEVSATLDTIYLNWLYNTEADFDRYQVHCDTIDGFTPTIFNMVAEPETSLYIDTDFDLQHNYYYKVAAVDNQDNISDYSDQAGVIFTGFAGFDDPNLPRTAVLYQNYPNPFNQRTIIRYYLPDIGYQPAEVQLDIYDVLGRKVRGLVDERTYPGEYEVIWDGTDDYGRELSSGVYFYRLFISKAELTKPKKLMLLK